MNREQVNELLYQALETEIGGQQIYEATISCATNDGLRAEWAKYLDETPQPRAHLATGVRRDGPGSASPDLRPFRGAQAGRVARQDDGAGRVIRDERHHAARRG